MTLEDLRFKDVSRRCWWRTVDGDCTHIDNDLHAEPEPPCACDYCPIAETAIDAGDDTDYSEGEQPVRVIDRCNPRKMMIEMKERPILFSAPMVRAIQAGQKMQTRRAVKPQPMMVTDDRKTELWDGPPAALQQQLERTRKSCPYGKPGDRLLVRETFFAYGRWETRFSAKKGRYEWHFIDMTEECGFSYLYAADNPIRTPANGRSPQPGWHRRPAIFMPRRAVRIFLEVIAARVERLNDISESDAIAEGVQSIGGGRYWLGADGLTPRGSATAAYRDLWISINGADSWNANPWVWVVEFKQIESQKGMK